MSVYMYIAVLTFADAGNSVSLESTCAVIASDVINSIADMSLMISKNSAAMS